MAYFKLNGNDYSMYVSDLLVTKKHTYKSATNAAGNTVVKYQTTKRTLTVGIIPLEAADMAELQKDINSFQVSVSYRDPETNELVENLKCIIPVSDVEYYTIRTDKVMYKSLIINIQEL